MRKKIKKFINASGMAVAMIVVMYFGALKIAFKNSKKDKKDERN